MIKLPLTITLLLVPANFLATPLPATPQSAPDIGLSARLASNKVRKGGTVQGTVTMDIPSGYHVNSNRPLEKFLIASQLQIEAPKGMRVGTVVYPRPILRKLKFSKSKVSVFEGRAVIRFSVTVRASFPSRTVELKGHLRYQACNDDICFPPRTRDVSVSLKVE
jgi:DsbC/DsbD-like thiol-disulfide interchange protein